MIKKMLKLAAVVALLGLGSAQAQWSGPSMHRTYTFTLLNAASSASAGTVTATPVLGLDAYQYCWLYAKIQGATGGTLDLYVQTSYDGGTTWVDIGHYTQLAAAAPIAPSVVAFSKWGPTVNTAPTTTPVTVNAASGTPALAANTFISGVMGNAMRVVSVAGAGMSAGATQQIFAFCST